MSYATIESALAAVIRKVSGYTTANVSEADYRILAHGQTKAAVLRRAASTSEQVSLGNPYTIQRTWTIHVELFLPLRGELKDLIANLDTEAQAVMDEVVKWPQLDNTSGVMDVEVTELPEPQEYVGEGRWAVQVVPVAVLELVDAVNSE